MRPTHTSKFVPTGQSFAIKLTLGLGGRDGVEKDCMRVLDPPEFVKVIRALYLVEGLSFVK